jgi:hypothetical protein
MLQAHIQHSTDKLTVRCQRQPHNHAVGTCTAAQPAATTNHVRKEAPLHAAAGVITTLPKQ